MKKSEFKIILIIVIIGIGIVTSLYNRQNKIENEKSKEVIENVDYENIVKNKMENETNESIFQNQEEFVKIFEDGKVNISSKLSETKRFGDLEVSNIQLKRNNNQTYISADIKNVGQNHLNGKTISYFDESGNELTTSENTVYINLVFLDKENNEIESVVLPINSINHGETEKLNTSIPQDVVNAYDLRINLK